MWILGACPYAASDLLLSPFLSASCMSAFVSGFVTKDSKEDTEFES